MKAPAAESAVPESQLHELSLPIASLIMSLESVFAVIAGIIILHESPTTRTLLGCAIMFAAIVISQIPSKKKNDKLTV